MRIEVIRGGKVLKALSKETKAEVGNAQRVEFASPRGAKKLWAVELDGEFMGLLKTWDDAAKFFREHNAIVKIADDGDGGEDGKPVHEAEVQRKQRTEPEKAKREPMRSPRVTKKAVHA